MNRKQFLAVLIALLLVGGAGLVLIKRHQQMWAVREAKLGDKVIANFKFNDIAAIHIRGASDLNVVRTNGLWRVRERNDYPANYQQIKDLLIKIKDLKVVQSEMVGPSQLARVNLAAPGTAKGSGILAEFKDAQGNVLNSLLVGKEHERQPDDSGKLNLNGIFNGRYILLPSDPESVLLISDQLASITPAPEMWLSHDFFKPENVQSFSLVSTNGGNSWKISREIESSPWTLAAAASGEVLNATAAAQTVEILGFLSFVDAMPQTNNVIPAQADPDATWPTILNITTFDHFVYAMKVSAKQPDGNYLLSGTVTAKIASDPSSADTSKTDNKSLGEKLAREQALIPWIYIVNASMIESLTVNRAGLLEKKTVADEPAK